MCDTLEGTFVFLQDSIKLLLLFLVLYLHRSASYISAGFAFEVYDVAQVVHACESRSPNCCEIGDESITRCGDRN